MDKAGTTLNDHGGPNTLVGLLVAAVANIAAALCFAELASTIPVGGSTYTYAYTAFNKATAWMVAYILLFEYSVGAFVVALTWSRSVLQPNSVLHPASGPRPEDPSTLLLAAVLVVVCALLLAFIEWKGVRGLLVGFVAASVPITVGGCSS